MPRPKIKAGARPDTPAGEAKATENKKTRLEKIGRHKTRQNEPKIDNTTKHFIQGKTRTDKSKQTLERTKHEKAR